MGREPDLETVNRALGETVKKLMAELAEVDRRLRSMTVVQETLIRRSEAENEKLAADLDGYMKAANDYMRENERLRATLKSIAANTYGYEPDVMSDEEAKNYFAGLFFDAQNKARAALSGDKQ